MEYIVHTDFIGKAICGEVNLPKGTIVKCYNDKAICYQGKALCMNRSESAHKYFARNDDGNGLKRAELIKTIKNTLQENEELWDRVMEDTFCAQFNKNGNGDTWLWSHEFYNADIADLERIIEIIS